MRISAIFLILILRSIAWSMCVGPVTGNEGARVPPDFSRYFTAIYEAKGSEKAAVLLRLSRELRTEDLADPNVVEILLYCREGSEFQNYDTWKLLLDLLARARDSENYRQHRDRVRVVARTLMGDAIEQGTRRQSVREDAVSGMRRFALLLWEARDTRMRLINEVDAHPFNTEIFDFIYAEIRNFSEKRLREIVPENHSGLTPRNVDVDQLRSIITDPFMSMDVRLEAAEILGRFGDGQTRAYAESLVKFPGTIRLPPKEFNDALQVAAATISAGVRTAEIESIAAKRIEDSLDQYRSYRYLPLLPIFKGSKTPTAKKLILFILRHPGLGANRIESDFLTETIEVAKDLARDSEVRLVLQKIVDPERGQVIQGSQIRDAAQRILSETNR